MKQPIVKVENLSHRYSIQWAIRDIHLEIQDTGIYGLLGSNGAGKSTLMNILCGVLKQTEGNVFINGIDTRVHPVFAKRCIGFLPQKPPLHVDLTVEEYLRYCAFLRDVPARGIKRAVDKVIGSCGIATCRKRLLRNLSGGYQQRVGIAQAIIHDPLLVVLDEPTNGLDPNQILEARHLVKEIGEERTVILSTHILTEVRATCDRIYMLEQGQVVFSGAVDEFDNYIPPSTLVVTFESLPAIEDLSSLEGMTGVERLAGKRYRLKFANLADAPVYVVKESVARGWDLSEITVERNTLDSVFAELSRKNERTTNEQ
ncbi:MAG: ATP-binding cassette domain-containing protein [Odoribacteraceae bacterium]|jgi:ABC-2 type transport system ATP-binding protein|nr:ATP-binding cassette domain-containing protein [Odoribacteraceae bacterium]